MIHKLFSTPLRMGISLGVVALVMLGASFAAVPLYQIFCQVTGFGGTPKIATGPAGTGAIQGEEITLRFDASIQPDLPWDFYPENQSITVTLGEPTYAYYIAKNRSQETVTGQATYNVTPFKAAQYLVKMDCFCFEEQTLAPNEEVRMPIYFFIDGTIHDDESDAREVKTVTLSYTFFKQGDVEEDHSVHKKDRPVHKKDRSEHKEDHHDHSDDYHDHSDDHHGHSDDHHDHSDDHHDHSEHKHDH